MRSVVAALACSVLAVAACAPLTPPLVGTAERDGVVLRGELTAGQESLAVSVTVHNDRAGAIELVPDQCGRLTEALLVRTTFEPEGVAWPGSVGAVKELVLEDQRSRQRPDRFHPRVPGQTSARVPECVRPNGPVRLGPGDEIAERWELPYSAASALDAVGAADTLVRLEAVEARPGGGLEFLDVFAAGTADAHRAGRAVRVELETGALLISPAAGREAGPTRGQLFDRLLEDDELRAWIDAQPADSWRLAALTPAVPGIPEYEQLRLRLVTTEFERAARIAAAPDGSDPVVDLPGEDHRARTFARRPATLPPGVPVIDEPGAFVLTDDLLVGELSLPSGRVIVGEYLLDLEPLDLVVGPGRYPVHATLARYEDQDFERVAYATLVLSDARTVRWTEADAIAVDGGSTTFVSVEGRDVLSHALHHGEQDWSAIGEQIFDARVAHDYLATEFALEEGLNLVEVGSGIGDGGYPVFVGWDAARRPTRVVADFLLVHLGWPAG